MSKVRKYIFSIMVLIIVLIGMLGSRAAFANQPESGGGWCDFVKLEKGKMWIFGRKFDYGEQIDMPMRFGYFVQNFTGEETIYETLYLKVRCDTLEGPGFTSVVADIGGPVLRSSNEPKFTEDIEEDISNASYQMKAGRSKPRKKLNCSVNIPFEDLEDDEGTITLESALWRTTSEDGEYILQGIAASDWYLDEDESWENHLEEAFARNDSTVMLYYSKLDDGVLIYEKKTALIKARLYLADKISWLFD